MFYPAIICPLIPTVQSVSHSDLCTLEFRNSDINTVMNIQDLEKTPTCAFSMVKASWCVYTLKSINGRFNKFSQSEIGIISSQTGIFRDIFQSNCLLVKVSQIDKFPDINVGSIWSNKDS